MLSVGTFPPTYKDHVFKKSKTNKQKKNLNVKLSQLKKNKKI